MDPERRTFLTASAAALVLAATGSPLPAPAARMGVCLPASVRIGPRRPMPRCLFCVRLEGRLADANTAYHMAILIR